MKILTHILSMLFFIASASLSNAAEEAISQDQILNQIHQLEGQQTAQRQIQNQSQQQTQQQAQKPSQIQSRQQQTQQHIQKPSQNQSQQQQTQRQGQTFVNIGPNWKIGTSWTVETANLQKQGSVQKQATPVAWVFTVVGETKIVDRDCFEVAIRCNDKSDRQPRVSIWVDKHSGMLMRLTTLTLVKGQWRSFTETYSVPQGQSTAVLGAIPSLPLDMPLFTQGNRSKDIDGMAYQVLQGPPGVKNIGESSFTYKINQSVKPVSEEQKKKFAGAKSLDLPVDFTDAVEVELQGGSKNQVRQVWAPGSPWPVYSNNGSSESRLIRVTNPQQ